MVKMPDFQSGDRGSIPRRAIARVRKNSYYGYSKVI